MKRFLGYIANKVVQATPRSKKVSPDIKSVKPTKLPVSKSIEKAKSDEFRKRYTALDKAEGKLKTGKQMMREGQKERKKLMDTGRAVQFKYTKSVHAVKPGDKDRFKGLTTEKKPKKFKKGKELTRENRMGGGMMGRRMGYSEGKLAVTPREKRLAAQYGDKKRITRGDVITIAKKKSGEEPMRDRMKQPLKRKKP